MGFATTKCNKEDWMYSPTYNYFHPENIFSATFKIHGKYRKAPTFATPSSETFGISGYI
jgi:hypothetical protein